MKSKPNHISILKYDISLIKSVLFFKKDRKHQKLSPFSLQY